MAQNYDVVTVNRIPDDESNPHSGPGWLTRLVDAGALGAAGFSRVRKAELLI